MEIELEKLIDAKLRRNNAMQVLNNVTLQTPYFVTDGDRIITVKGTPNLSNIRSIMIESGIQKDPGGNGPKICAEVWVNELRMSDFDEKGGWAATARVTAKLADLGTMSLVGNHSTSGWGSIEKKSLNATKRIRVLMISPPHSNWENSFLKKRESNYRCTSVTLNHSSTRNTIRSIRMFF
ncbi:MAG: hypothetical protein IPJ66_06280 [Bacteroidetes bacterium]|nr:hypothetical protein [Bacteroidota bacterium]